jgi:hypothetical protein
MVVAGAAREGSTGLIGPPALRCKKTPDRPHAGPVTLKGVTLIDLWRDYRPICDG